MKFMNKMKNYISGFRKTKRSEIEMAWDAIKLPSART